MKCCTGEKSCSDGLRVCRQHALAHPRVLGGVEHGKPGGERSVLHRGRNQDLCQRLLGKFPHFLGYFHHFVCLEFISEL